MKNEDAFTHLGLKATPQTDNMYYMALGSVLFFRKLWKVLSVSVIINTSTDG